MKPEILIVGSYHFSSANDLVNTNDLFNMDKHHNEVIELIDVLKQFRPDALAAEWTKHTQEALDGQYASYLNDEVTLSENEIHQILFRLGKSLYPTYSCCGLDGFCWWKRVWRCNRMGQGTSD